MPLTDDELLNFDHSSVVDFDVEAARQRLAEQGETYRAQLVAAKWVDGCRERMEAGEGGRMDGEDWQEGFSWGMRQIAAHLRLGDFLPGGMFHDETDSGSP